MVSSLRASSPQSAIVTRPSAAHKRGVDFSHVRRSSVASAATDRSGTNKKVAPLARPIGQPIEEKKPAVDTQAIPSSPAGCADSVVRSRKENPVGTEPRGRRRRGQTNSQVIETEARKVSTELEKFCEEAFNRSSVGASVRTATTHSHAAYETPSSSFSNDPEHHTAQQGFPRPLPETPSETPNTYITWELAETRRRLVERYAQDSSAQNTTYQDVLAQLDSLLKDPVKSVTSDGRRIASAPEPRSPDYSGYLPIISEEARTAEADESHGVGGAIGHMTRSATSPRKEGAGPDVQNTTLRLIDASSPAVAPLVIRKASNISSIDSGASQSQRNHDNIKPRYYSHAPALP